MVAIPLNQDVEEEVIEAETERDPLFVLEDSITCFSGVLDDLRNTSKFFAGDDEVVDRLKIIADYYELKYDEVWDAFNELTAAMYRMRQEQEAEKPKPGKKRKSKK